MRLALAGSVLVAVGAAQDLTVEPPTQTTPIYIHNAVLHTVSGDVIENGALLLENGKIARVFRGDDDRVLDAPEHVLVNAGGRHVYPGLISAYSAVGLTEIGSLRDTIDRDEVGEVNAEVRAVVALNPDATAIPVTRVNGVLTVGLVPSGGMIAGQLSVASLAGWTWEDMTVKDAAGLVVSWPGNRRRPPWMRRRGDEAEDDAGKRLKALAATFAQARAYHAARAADATIAVDLREEGFGAVLRGEAPVFVQAANLEAIQQAVDWAVQEKLRLVIVGGSGAGQCVDLLRRHDVAVIVTGTHRLPSRRDADYDEPFRLPATLEAAGVRWCLASNAGGYANERNLPYHAGTAIGFGLDPRAALRAMTLSAAEILGVDEQLGSLQVGKDATLFIADGPPWELTTKVGEVYVRGRAIEQVSKHTELAKKYREKYRQLGLWPK